VNCWRFRNCVMARLGSWALRPPQKSSPRGGLAVRWQQPPWLVIRRCKPVALPRYMHSRNECSPRARFQRCIARGFVPRAAGRWHSTCDAARVAGPGRSFLRASARRTGALQPTHAVRRSKAKGMPIADSASLYPSPKQPDCARRTAEVGCPHISILAARVFPDTPTLNPL